MIRNLEFKDTPTEEDDVPSRLKPIPSQSSRRKKSIWKHGIYYVVFAVLGALPLAYVGFGYSQNPYRSLPAFPASNYLLDYRGTTGGRFAAHLEVAASLGSKDGVGRLYAFTLKDQNERIPVLVPDSFAGQSFFKGQDYFAVLHVNDKGVIYADYLSKD